MICLSELLRQSILERLSSLWKNVYGNKLPKNRNELILCTDQYHDALFYSNTDKKNHNLFSADGDVMNQFQEISKNIKKISL
jgi:hypothetical protein